MAVFSQFGRVCSIIHFPTNSMVSLNLAHYYSLEHSIHRGNLNHTECEELILLLARIDEFPLSNS